jgi:hypothetical protein
VAASPQASGCGASTIEREAGKGVDGRAKPGRDEKGIA